MITLRNAYPDFVGARPENLHATGSLVVVHVPEVYQMRTD